jgi:hypothetical protein
MYAGLSIYLAYLEWEGEMRKLLLMLVLMLGMAVAQATPDEPRLQEVRLHDLPDFNPDAFALSLPASYEPHKVGFFLADIILKPVAAVASTFPGVGGLVGFATFTVIDVGNRIVNPSVKATAKAPTAE